ncbi:MAG TPA: YbdK family carboxylate-amine ligase [Gemmatimonadota bacterium]|nr:YbdK family carboxylate-amine ligase [Gemmatimonadota bacterium]
MPDSLTTHSLPLGVEEEFQHCDPETGDLTPAVDRILRAAPPELAERLGYELLHTVVEGNILKSADLAEATARVRALRCDLLEIAASMGVAIGIGGVHPFARWQDQDFVSTDAYQWVGRQLQYLARRNLSFGLHVHIEVEDPEARVYVANQLRRWCAPLLALSANAPFFEGVDTGFQTIRMHVFGSFPRTGFAPRFESWSHYMRVIDALIASGAITAPRQVWWNVRPHVAYPTVEFRMLDMQIGLDRTRALVGLAQAIGAELLSRWEAREPEWQLEPAFLADGWFKAQRFGWQEPIAHPISGETVTLLDEIEEMLRLARPWAAALGTAAEAIDGTRRILDDGPECEWQRREWEECGRDLAALQRRIFARVRDEARCEALVS